MSGNSKKRKIENEKRIYQESWENDYLITNNSGKLQCLVCMQIVSVPKEYRMLNDITQQCTRTNMQHIRKELDTHWLQISKRIKTANRYVY